MYRMITTILWMSLWPVNNTARQRQTAVTAYLSSKQLLLFVSTRPYCMPLISDAIDKFTRPNKQCWPTAGLSLVHSYIILGQSCVYFVAFWNHSTEISVQIWYSTPTNRRVAQPVTWRDRPITAVIQLLFKWGGYLIWAEISTGVGGEGGVSSAGGGGRYIHAWTDIAYRGIDEMG